MKIENAHDFATELVFGKTPAGQQFMTLVVKATFQIRNGSTAASAPAGDQLPILIHDAPLDPDKAGGVLLFESELVPFKPRADIIVVGSALAPGGVAAPVVDVTVSVGRTRKVLRVFGDRRWSSTPGAAPLIAGPVDFVAMPMTADRSYGGIDTYSSMRAEDPASRPWCEQNFEGRGFIGSYAQEAIDGRPLPNIEDPAFLIRTWSDRPRPVGCGYFPRNSEPRKRHYGTYDTAWAKERRPELPNDFRFDAFNSAFPDLQVDGYLVGNEFVSLRGFLADRHSLDFVLPCIKPRVTARRGARGAPLFEPLVTPLDTLVILPEQLIFWVIWRGNVLVPEVEAPDVESFGIEYDVLAPETPPLPAREHR